MTTLLPSLAIAAAIETAELPESFGSDPVARRVLQIYQPRERIEPSVWAEKERVLKKGTAAAAGAYRVDYVPWLRSMLDEWRHEPDKKGAITTKFAQACISEVHVTQVGFLMDRDPGPILYLCTKQAQARKFSIERFGPMIAESPALQEVVLQGKDGNETIHYKETAGGPLILAGAGSPNDFISNPYRWIFVDEYDEMEEIPGHGDPLPILEARAAEWSTVERCFLWVYAHPSRPDRGVWKVYADRSDKREWVYDCPLCQETIVPDWSHVQIDDDDATTAVYHCPHCGAGLSDVERWSALHDRVDGGTGRFESQLPDDEAEAKEFIGYHVSRLCHPRVSIEELARKRIACRTESQLKVFLNKDLGLPYLPVSDVITEEMIQSRIDDQVVADVCPADTMFITAGVDVQAPKNRPTLYFTISAWTRAGVEVVLRYGRVQGWPLLHRLLSTYSARPGGDGADMRISACAIDHGYLTRQVYGFCREAHGGVQCIPYKHTPRVYPDDPTIRKDRKDPVRPELGKIVRLETCRVYWMDRALGRFSDELVDELGGGIVLPPTVDKIFVNHMLANIKVSEEDEHGHAQESYVKEQGRRDDWLQCLVGAELAAVGLGLDKYHAPVVYADPEGQAAATLGHEEAKRRRIERSRSKRGAYRTGRRKGGRSVW